MKSDEDLYGLRAHARKVYKSSQKTSVLRKFKLNADCRSIERIRKRFEVIDEMKHTIRDMDVGMLKSYSKHLHVKHCRLEIARDIVGSFLVACIVMLALSILGSIAAADVEWRYAKIFIVISTVSAVAFFSIDYSEKRTSNSMVAVDDVIRDSLDDVESRQYRS